MYQRHHDTLLLEEAYKATQLKQHFSDLTVKQLHFVIENASPTELEVIEEFLGGMRNLARGAKEGIQRAGRSAKTAAGRAASRAGEAVKGAGEAAVGAAKGGVEAVKAGGKQVGSNVKDMYKSGEAHAGAEKRKGQLVNHLAQLEELLAAHIESSRDKQGRVRSELSGPIENMTLGKLKRALAATEGRKKQAAAQARAGGVLGGVGAAAQRGYEKQRAARAEATGAAPAGATPAPA